MRNKIIFAGIILLLLVLSLGGVNARFVVNKFTNEFSVTSPNNNELRICSCATEKDQIDVVNVGNLDAIFDVYIESNHADWITLSESNFYLKPGEKKSAHIFINVPCEAKASFTYKVHVHSNHGRNKFLTKYITTDKCQNILATLDAYDKSINPCTAATFELHVKNVAPFKETYTLDFGEQNDYVEVSNWQFKLELAEEKTVKIFFKKPCEVWGVQTIPFIIKAEQNNLKETIYYDLEIRRAYEYEIVLEDKLFVCSKVVTEVPVTFRNLEPIANDYAVTYIGPGFTSFEPEAVHLEGFEEKTFHVIANCKEAHEGMHKLGFNAVSSLGEIEKDASADLEVAHCYDFGVELSERFDKVCCGKKDYVVNVRNNGLFEETFNLRIEGNAWSTLERETVTLKPSENKNIGLEVDIPCVDDHQEIRVVMESARTGLVAQSSLVINSFTRESCFAVDMPEEDYKIIYETPALEVRARHEGVEAANYKVKLESEFLKLEDKEVFLAPGEEVKLNLDVKDAVADYNKGKYLNHLTFTYEDEDLSYVNDFFVQLGDKNVFVKFFEYLGDHIPCLIMFIVFIGGCVAAVVLVLWESIVARVKGRKYILLFRRRPYTTAEKLKALIYLIVAFIVILLVISPNGIPSVRDEVNLTQQPLYYEMLEDTSLEINLGQYFYDPDDDILSYYATPVKNIKVDIAGDTAVLTPDMDFAGERKVIFIADDAHGGRTESAVVTLNVLEVKDVSAKDIFTKFCRYFFLLFLFIVAIVTYLGLCRRGKSYWEARRRHL